MPAGTAFLYAIDVWKAWLAHARTGIAFFSDPGSILQCSTGIHVCQDACGRDLLILRVGSEGEGAFVGQSVQTIEFVFQSAELSANTATIVIDNGGSFQLASNSPLQFNGSFMFASLSMTSGSISFENTSAGVPINGTVAISVSATTDPTVTVTNVTGQVSLSWPTSKGPRYQMISAGDPVTLSGFAA